jgi:hypothetical protein
VLKVNECKATNVDMEKPGAVGRFRMCAGIALRAALKRNGRLVIAGKDYLALVDKPAKRKRGKAKKAS